MKEFLVDRGIPVRAVTADEMRELDRVAVEETGPELIQMMENAGRSLALEALAMLPEKRQGAPVIVLAGGGGNGGGGICAARHLANHGAWVTLCLTDPDRLGDAAQRQVHVFCHTNGKLVSPADLLRQEGGGCALVIDALIGYSLRGTPSGRTAELIDWANRCGVSTLSLDVPSGVEATTGETPGVWVRAAATLTLAMPKTGLHPATAGRLALADIGIPEQAYKRAGLGPRPPFHGRYRIPLHVHIR